MTEPLPDIWNSRDLPTLREAARITDADFSGARLDQVMAATSLDRDETLRAFKALQEAGIVEVSWASGNGSRVTAISPEARQIVGLWPTPETAFDRIVVALEDIAANSQGKTQLDASTALEALKNSAQALRTTIGAAALGTELR